MATQKFVDPYNTRDKMFLSKQAGRNLVMINTRKIEISKGTEPVVAVNKNWLNQIATFDLKNLRLVEYRTADFNWKKMFKVMDNDFQCYLCDTKKIQSFPSLKQHLLGKRHITNYELILGIHHPLYFSNKPRADPQANNSNKGTSDKLSANNAQPDKSISSTPGKDLLLTKITEAPKTMEQKKQECVEKIAEFRFDDLILVEYQCSRTDTWKKMLMKAHNNSYRCALCVTAPIREFISIKQHINGKKHKGQLEFCKAFRHPKLTPPKNVPGNITSASVTKNNNSTNKTKEANNTVTVKPLGKIDDKSPSNLATQKDNENPSTIVIDISENDKDCTLEEEPIRIITVEDSPERTLPEPEKKVVKDSTLVLNPAALMAKNAAAKEQTSVKENTSVKKPAAVNERISVKQLVPVKELNTTVKKPTPAIANNANINNTVMRENSEEMKFTKQLPGFISKTLKHDVKPDVEGLIGVEYVVKILQSANDSSPRFECTLCEVEDGYGMQEHLTGMRHRLKYLDKHFATCMRQFEKYREDIEYRPLLIQIANKLAMAVERYHGRELPYECLKSEYRSNRHGIMSKVYSFRHASEYSGPSFTNVIDKKTLEELSKRSEDPPVSDFSKRKITFDPNYDNTVKRIRRESPKLGVEEHKKLVDEFLKNTTIEPRRSRSPRRYRSRSPLRAKPILPKKGSENAPISQRRDVHIESRPRRSKSPDSRGSPPRRPGNILQVYRNMVDDAVNDIYLDYKGFVEDPESHPLYNEEWKIFWQKRSDELILKGRDPGDYDFQPEWILYWPGRMEEILKEDIEKIKKNLKQKCGIPDNIGLDNSENSQSHFKSNISEDDVDKSAVVSVADLKREDAVKNFRNPSPVNKNIDEPKAKSMVGTKSREDMHRVSAIIQDDHKSQSEELDTGPLSTVSVLRLLTALEDHLGSLGPKVVDLLAKALTLDKIKSGSDDSLLTADNCVFLETVREKFRGQLLAGVLDANKTRPVKKAIQDITLLVNQAMENNKKKEQQETIQTRFEPIFTSGNTSSDKSRATEKKEIAARLANALAAQGKTEFSAEQLEQLVAVYSVIEKKQREIAAPKTATETKTKSLSETLADFLKPTGTPATNLNSNNNVSDGRSRNDFDWRSQNQILSSSNNNPFGSSSNRDSGQSSSYPTQTAISNSLAQRPTGLAPYSFGQLSQFNTSLNTRSLVERSQDKNILDRNNQNSNLMNRSNQAFNDAHQQNFNNNSNWRGFPANMQNSNMQQLSSQNVNNNVASQNSMRLNTQMMSNSRNLDLLANNNASNLFDQQRFMSNNQSQNSPVFSSVNRVERNADSGNNNNNNSASSGMVSYPNIWQRPGGQPNMGQNFQQGMIQRQQPAPLGWQQNNQQKRNSGRR